MVHSPLAHRIYSLISSCVQITLYLCHMIKKRIAIFASGSGSNALNLINFFANHPAVEVGIVLSNKKDAPVVNSCEELGLDVFALNNEEVSEGGRLVSICQNQGIDFVVLAGYLRKIPNELIDEYPQQIINNHPSLLPKFGGAGMYGAHVHEMVVSMGEIESGISIHLVNSYYDKGQMIAQFYTPISPEDSAKKVEEKVRKLEIQYFPLVVEQYILGAK
jgi:phosphoribosylglycinamide formyltransferase-1